MWVLTLPENNKGWQREDREEDSSWQKGRFPTPSSVAGVVGESGDAAGVEAPAGDGLGDTHTPSGKNEPRLPEEVRYIWPYLKIRRNTQE